ncbi:MAG: haloacid dehalogenase type II [Alphaproteobacteria bacterium]|nr:haloacid dehalogenase type II [Alphaproteobacteria bacterium]MCB9929573.1 haloacid dehalogenase type II [Alphaproteobacteria bacterium]
MSSLQDIQACVFDAYGTLFDFSSPMQRRREKIGPEADRFNLLWRQKQLEYSWLRSLMGIHADFWQVTAEALDYALAACNIDNPALRAELMELYLSIAPYPESLATVERLKAAKYQTAILSNGSVTMLTAAINHARLTPHLDAVLSVDEAGIYKPHPRVYQLVLDRFNLQAHQVLFVSSNAWDVAGAAHFGFQVAWCNRADAPAEKLPGKPTAVIHTLDEIPTLLSV